MLFRSRGCADFPDGGARPAHADAADRAVLIATHDVELVAELADRVIFLADGELISEGETHEALTSSPAFAPQVAKAFPEKGILTVAEAREALEK